MNNKQDSEDYRISTKALVFNGENKILFIKERNGYWGLPGGGLDYGEEPYDGLKREIKEEMGLEVSVIKDNPSYFLLGLKMVAGELMLFMR
jgi:8-oxo-dGTP pyrophosphatase MutT (NUDIX family)